MRLSKKTLQKFIKKEMDKKAILDKAINLERKDGSKRELFSEKDNITICGELFKMKAEDVYRLVIQINKLVNDAYDYGVEQASSKAKKETVKKTTKRK